MPIYPQRPGRVETDKTPYLKDSPDRPWEQPEPRNGRNKSQEVAESHLSDLGLWLKARYEALLAYLATPKEKTDKQAA